MRPYERMLEVAQPPAEEFAFVTRPRNSPLWQPSIVQFGQRDRGPLRVGAQATAVGRFLGGAVETTWTCKEHEPPRRSTIERAGGRVSFCATYELEPRAGGTRFTWRVETRANGASGLAGPVVATASRTELAGNAARVKRLLEGAGE